MENPMSLSITNLVNQLQYELVGKLIQQIVIIKINSEKLSTMGEMHFPVNLLAWKEFISKDILKRFSTILEYYLWRKKCDTTGLSTQDIFKKATELLIATSETWPVSLAKCSLQENIVCLFIAREKIVRSAIKNALQHGENYGKRKFTGKSVCLSIDEDKDSDLTTARLRMIKNVSKRLLQHQGFCIKDEQADYNYMLSTKSHGLCREDFHLCVCGVVKNQSLNRKDTSLTWSVYLKRKIEELKQIEEEKISSAKTNLENIAQAEATFELLAIRPHRPIFIGNNEDPERRSSSSKGGSFVLYNAARINAILEKFKNEEILGYYSKMPDIDQVDFTLINQEEEWDLIYNFVNGYVEMIENCVRVEEKFETNPQTICFFLSRLSQKFSAYYRRIRILTEGRDHLEPTMMARLYLLQALQIVVNNSLEMLNIKPVSYM